jgi:hypothetical protein
MQFRRLSFPGVIPGHSFWRSSLHLPPATATLSSAVALDDHNIKMAPIIRMIFTTEVSPALEAKYLAANSLMASRRLDVDLNQGTALAPLEVRS